MKNQEVASLLRNIAFLLELQEELIFKIRAYERVALAIEELQEDIEEISKGGKLQEIPGVGKAIAEKITEFLSTGHSRYYEKLKKKVPVDIDSLHHVPGLGPKTIMKLYKELKVKNIDDLQKAATQGKIRNIKSLGEKVEQNILKGIKFAKKAKRFLLYKGDEIAAHLKKELLDSGFASHIEVVGSLRRKKETIGDIDILAISKKPNELMDHFSKMKSAKQVLSKGDTKSSLILEEGIQADLRVFSPECYGAAMLYFTGSKQHNIELRNIAISKSMKLSEYGLFARKTNKLLAGKTEQECYRKLGLNYIEPELRETEGEIEAAGDHTLPKLISYGDVKSDLQMHTAWSDGTNSIKEMALEAKRLGHEYICITDHAGTFKIANALDPKRLQKQRNEIEKINKEISGITILQGAEVNIRDNGEMDLDGKTMKDLDVVLGSIHSGFKNPKEKITKRIIKAMENEHVDIIAHPTGRLLNEREGYGLDFDMVLDAAKRTKTVLEINAHPSRMDLAPSYIRAAIKKGVMLSIGTDSHDASGLGFFKYGVSQARRGWAQKKDVINAFSLSEMKRKLK